METRTVAQPQNPYLPTRYCRSTPYSGAAKFPAAPHAKYNGTFAFIRLHRNPITKPPISCSYLCGYVDMLLKLLSLRHQKTHNSVNVDNFLNSNDFLVLLAKY
ncbi:hypothetical protein CHUAL_002294 [Chamberlinius hualienensis]